MSVVLAGDHLTLHLQFLRGRQISGGRPFQATFARNEALRNSIATSATPATCWATGQVTMNLLTLPWKREVSTYNRLRLYVTRFRGRQQISFDDVLW